MIRSTILSASGGLVYHTRAALSYGRWQDTRRSVSTLVRNWLESASLSAPIGGETQDVIIIGPSAGYLLEPGLFGDRALTIIDPDAFASLIFRSRFSESQVDWHSRSDLLPFTSRSPKAFSEFIASKSKAAILFLGVLGQIDLHESEFRRSKAEATRRLLADLIGRNWASLHDLESTTFEHSLRQIPPSILNLDLSESGTARDRIEVFEENFSALGIKTKLWVDHETEWLGGPAATVPWLLTPRKFQNLGWVTFKK